MTHSRSPGWPLDRTSWVVLGAYYVVAVALSVGMGLLIAEVLDAGAFGRADLDISEWFADRRTPTWNDLAQLGAGLADTLVVVPVCAVVVAVFWLRWRRFHEATLVVGSILVEKAVFVSTTFLVDRERPPVGQLDGSPPTSSFPSGHVAAAVGLYFGLWLVLRIHGSPRAVQAIAFVLAAGVVLTVSASRLELGMHYASDVVWGVILGSVTLFVMYRAVRWPPELRSPSSPLPRSSRQPAAATRGPASEPDRVARSVPGPRRNGDREPPRAPVRTPPG